MSAESINAVNTEHLTNGHRPIMACIGNFRHEVFASSDEVQSSPERTNVNYFEKPEGLQGMKNGGRSSYVISYVDSHNKISEGYFDCTGVVVVGVDKVTGKNISMLTHQDPRYVFSEKERQERFSSDLENSVQELISRSDEGSVDAVIFGGQFCIFDRDSYKNSIRLLSSVLSKKLGFEPTIIVGPKGLSTGSDTVHFSTDTRHLFLVRQDAAEDSVQPFMPNQAPEKLSIISKRCGWEECDSSI